MAAFTCNHGRCLAVLHTKTHGYTYKRTTTTSQHLLPIHAVLHHMQTAHANIRIHNNNGQFNPKPQSHTLPFTRFKLVTLANMHLGCPDARCWPPLPSAAEDSCHGRPQLRALRLSCHTTMTQGNTHKHGTNSSSANLLLLHAILHREPNMQTYVYITMGNETPLTYPTHLSAHA